MEPRLSFYNKLLVNVQTGLKVKRISSNLCIRPEEEENMVRVTEVHEVQNE